jgi:cytoskeletal protein CcmA (bactofilin family)
MAIFGKKQTPAAETRISHTRASMMTPPAGLSIIGVGMTVRGDLETSGVVKVEGTVEGGVRATAQVLVAKGGTVRGDIETTEAIVGGFVDGSIHATDRVEVQAAASVQGDISTRRISVAEGGSLNGQIHMEEEAAPARGAREVKPGATASASGARLPSAQPSPPEAPVTRMEAPPHPPAQRPS